MYGDGRVAVGGCRARGALAKSHERAIGKQRECMRAAGSDGDDILTQRRNEPWHADAALRG